MSRLRSEGNYKDAFQDGEDGEADRGEREASTDVYSTDSLIAVHAGVPGDEGWETDWSSSPGFAVEDRTVPILTMLHTKNYL